MRLAFWNVQSVATLLENLMTLDNSVSVIKHEVDDLVDLQIETMSQESSLTSAQLADYQIRSQKIRALYRKLDQIASAKVTRKFGQVA